MAALQRTMLAVAGMVMASSLLHAQPTILRSVPQKISYQAVARDPTGRVVPNKQIVVRITILGGSATGAVQYSETHEVRTNQFGLFALHIGDGVPTVGTFSDIPWTDGNQWVRVELDPNGGTNYLPAGESQLVSVPYALVANKAVNMSLRDLIDIDMKTPTPGQVLVYNGTTWVSTTLVDSSGNRGVLVTPRLTGTGLAGSPLDIAGQGARPGQVLKWNGTSWVPGNDSVGAGSGTGGGNYTAGNGISIIGTTIAHTIWQDNATNTTYNGGNVGIGTTAPNGSALLDLSSTRQGVLVPRMTSAQRDAITQPATSLLFYNTTTNRFEYNAGTSAVPNWQALGGSTTININNITGAGAGSNAASLAIPDGADSMVVSAPGLQAGSVVTLTIYDPGEEKGIQAHVGNKIPSTGFIVRFSAPFPNPDNNARLDYIIVNP